MTIKYLKGWYFVRIAKDAYFITKQWKLKK
jgi:hypothetical protein